MLKLVIKQSGQEFPLGEGRHTVGRDPENDLVLDDDSVSGFHAQIIVEGDAIGVVDLGSTNGTTIDGKPFSGRQGIKAWQTLSFGSVEVECVDPEGRRPTSVMPAIRDEDLAPVASSSKNADAAPRASGKVRARLKCLSTDGSFPASVELRDALEIGRESSSGLALPSDMVSGKHARIEWQGDHYTVTDLGSTNGTWVNGDRVQSKRLASGDRLAFDEIEYLFQMEGEPERKATTVNPAIGGERKGTRVRPAVDAPKKTTRDSSPSATVASDTRESARPSSDDDRTRVTPSLDGRSETPAARPAETATRVQPKVQRPVPRAPVPRVSAAPPQNRPPPPVAPPAPAPAPAPPQKPEKQQPQQIIVKQKGSGCMIAMLAVITLVIAFPLLVFVFKVGFLIAIFNEIKSFLGL